LIRPSPPIWAKNILRKGDRHAKELCKLAGILISAVLAELGAAEGWLYHRYVGCGAGTCVIASSPWLSTGFGGVIGLLLGFVLRPGSGDCRNDGSTE
jgi:hypothetical protein